MSLLIQGVGRIHFFVVVGQKSPFPSCLSTKEPSPLLEASAFPGTRPLHLQGL